MKLQLTQIQTDGGTQARAALNESVVAEYAESITAGTDLPPVTVFHDGKAYWLADGFHRFHAHRKALAVEIDADVRAGTKRDAILHSVGANANHGLRRTNDDKRCAVRTLIDDKEWGQWSDREISRACGVSHTLVAAVRLDLTGNSASEDSARTYKTKHGTVAVMDVTGLKGSAKGVIGLPQDGVAASTKTALHHVESVSTYASQAAPLRHLIETPSAAPTIPIESESANFAPITTTVSAPLQGHQEQPVDDDDHGLDQAELLDELQSENARLTALIEAAEADDLKAEAIKWRRCYENARRQQSEAMDSAARSEQREKRTKALLMRCGKAVGEEDPNKIPTKVAQLVKANREAP